MKLVRVRDTALCLLLAMAPAAFATEGGTGAYLLGSRDSLAGIVAPPGTYLSADLVFINASVDALSISGLALANANTSAFVTKLNFTQGFEGKLWGGRPAITFTLPLVTGDLEFDSVLFGAQRRIKDSESGTGDFTITPGLGWDNGNNHVAIQASFFLPTGYYHAASIDVPNRQISALSFGKNRVAIYPALSWTNLDTTNGREFNASTGITFSFRNQATDYQTAPEWSFELAALQHLKNGLSFGLAGYGYQQLGEDSGAGADQLRAALGAQSLKARVFGLGPIVTYSTKIGERSLTMKAEYDTEFSARRRFEGDSFQLTFALGL
jgi:hypothetical protein